MEYEYTLNEEQQELLVAILDAAWRQGATKRGLEEISSIIRTGGKKKELFENQIESIII